MFNIMPVIGAVGAIVIIVVYLIVKGMERKVQYSCLDQEKFNQMFATAMQQYRQELRDNDCGDWSRAARKFVTEQGIFAGGDPGPDGQPNFMWEDLLTREQCAQVLHASATKFGLA